jgi:hypothetical protein
MMSARVSLGAVTRLFPTNLTELGRIQKPYDVSKNGQRFLIPVAPSRAQSFSIVSNWTARLPK